MAGGNFDGQAYILGPADSVDQQDTKGRGTVGMNRHELLRQLLAKRKNKTSMIPTLLGYGSKGST